jgi:hypothetical protein
MKIQDENGQSTFSSYHFLGILLGIVFAVYPWVAARAASSACDLNGDGLIDLKDVQVALNQALGLAACSSADLRHDGKCTILDVQLIVNSAVNGVCQASTPSPTPTPTPSPTPPPTTGCTSQYKYPNTARGPSPAPSCPPPLPPNPNPANSTSQDYGPIHPCMFIRDGVRYQAIKVSGMPGQQRLDSRLYFGKGCAANQFADEIGFGQTVGFASTMIFWYLHFWDEPATSAIWTVSNLTTPCIDYSLVPDCK